MLYELDASYFSVHFISCFFPMLFVTFIIKKKKKKLAWVVIFIHGFLPSKKKNWPTCVDSAPPNQTTFLEGANV